MAKRLYAMGAERYRNGFKPTLQHDLIDLPRKWKKPRIIFVNSMSDLFQEAVPDDFIRRVFDTMRDCPQHTFQILTKRSARLRAMAASLQWPTNIWMGVSVEDARAVGRIKDLVDVPVHVRFLSCEPLIGPLGDLDLEWYPLGDRRRGSGPGARPMHGEWVESICRRCRAANVPFFFKQWGGMRKDRTGRELHGRTYDEMPQRDFNFGLHRPTHELNSGACCNGKPVSEN